MKCKIFNVKYYAKVLVIENGEFVEFYLQINSSDWFFCVGCKENFDDITQEFAESIVDEYYELCDESEQVLLKHSEAELGCLDKFKKVTHYEFNDFVGEGTTLYEFNIDDETNIGHLPVPEETKEWFNDKEFVAYFLERVNKGYCNSGKKRAIKLLSVDNHPWMKNELRLSVQFV